MAPSVRRACEVALVAFAVVVGAALVRTICHAVFNETIPYTPFYPAIVLATMYGGRLGGAIATVLGGFFASFWLRPFGKPMIQEWTDLVGLCLFLAVNVVLVGLCEAMRRAQERAEKAVRDEQRAVAREQAARIEAEAANRMKDQILASASHELRTPLQAILGWTHLLGRSDLDEKDRAAALEVIARNARVQSRLVEDLLDMSRIVAGKLRISPRLVNPRHVIDDAIQTIATAAQAKQIEIVRNYPDEAPSVWADPDRLQQVVWNLLSNAVKFSPLKSSVRVALRRMEASWEIEVADEGDGIPAELLPHIFERFRQGDGSGNCRAAGLGLGLSIAKQLVELHGGRIQARSDGAGRGSRFQVTLPALVGAAGARPADEPTPPIRRLQGVRVLVVDDDEATCELIARILREHRSEVMAVNSVDRALRVVTGFEPDVVVSDIAMPEQDGYDLLRRLRQCEPRGKGHVAAVAVTALSSPDDQRRSFEAGYRLHLIKPVDPSELTSAVAELAHK